MKIDIKKNVELIRMNSNKRIVTVKANRQIIKIPN